MRKLCVPVLQCIYQFYINSNLWILYQFFVNFTMLFRIKWHRFSFVWSFSLITFRLYNFDKMNPTALYDLKYIWKDVVQRCNLLYQLEILWALTLPVFSWLKKRKAAYRSVSWWFKSSSLNWLFTWSIDDRLLSPLDSFCFIHLLNTFLKLSNPSPRHYSLSIYHFHSSSFASINLNPYINLNP